MKPVYSRRAISDLIEIAEYYSVKASPKIALSIERRFNEVIDRICRASESAPRVSQRSDVRVVNVVRYPFRIFYRVPDDMVDILHIRPTSRRHAAVAEPK